MQFARGTGPWLGDVELERLVRPGGIESPELTSSLAIAGEIARIVGQA